MNPSIIEYPQFFAQKLATNSEVRGGVDLTLALVANVIQLSRLPFFPDYTDHGAGHLTRVLAIADKLIPEGTREVFTAEDAAVLILSILLHDLALHLSEAGFKSLLYPKRDLPPSKSRDWAKIWQEFLTVAKHWDERRLVELFGADESGSPCALVSDPFDHYENLTESDRKLIGEFIRRHHAELAYQFAALGFPGVDGEVIQLESFDPELRVLAGIVARSHGFAMRTSIERLQERQLSALEQDNVHPVYLMGLLRIADFLELGTDRAPLIAFPYKEMKSSVSRREWRTNQIFRRISWDNPYPGSIDIPAKPSDVYSFLDLKEWLTAIQSELDTTWAVIGEVYAAHPKFSKFGFTIRRVHSRILDDPEGFARNALFVPKRVELGIASANVLQLFIEPLYGRHSEIGIRELIQNAVDAVRERWEFEKNHPTLAGQDKVLRDADVIVWLDDPDENGIALLTVSDNGIGMTEDVVANYFLKAGASFRRSIAWKREFESQARTDGGRQLRSRVLRSGRFGIGVLAAFLLGDEIEVLTRHITSERGLRFSVRLDLRPSALEIAPIQLTYDSSLPVGTTVRLKVNKVDRARVEKKGNQTMIFGTDIFSDSSLWDWYCLNEPSVLRLQGPDKKILKQSATVPSEGSALPKGWHILPTRDYRTIHALVCGASGTRAPAMVCNGIKVKGDTGFVPSWDHKPAVFNWKSDLFSRQGVFGLHVPDVSVFDPDGNLPLNLQRTGLTNLDVDFIRAAFQAQIKSALAKLILSAPSEPKLTKRLEDTLIELFSFEQVIPVFFTKSGTALLTATNLRLAQVKNCLLLNIEASAEDWLAHLWDRYDAIIIARWGMRDVSPLYSLNDLNPWIASSHLITRSGEEPIVKRPLRFRYKEFSLDGFHVYRTANCSPSLLKQGDIEILRDKFAKSQESKKLRSQDDFVAAELFLKPQAYSDDNHELSIGHYWEQIICEPIIPFDAADRASRLRHAHAELQEYIADIHDSSPHGH